MFFFALRSRMRPILYTATISTAIFAVATRSYAQTITFNNLPGQNLGAFSTAYTESSFVVTPTTTGLVRLFNYGNPVPALGCLSFNQGTMTVTGGTTGLFRFNSFDFSSNISQGAFYQVIGTRSGVTQFSLIAFDNSVVNAFHTIINPNAQSVVDTLTFTFANNSTSSSVDNINVIAAATPEPSSITLLALSGLPALGMIARRRRKA